MKGLAGSENDDSLAGNADQILLFQHFQNPACHLSGAVHQPSDFLSGDHDLNAIRARQRIRLFAQFDQGACNPTGDIVKRQIAEFPGRVAQSAGHLLADGEDDLRVIGHIVIEIAVTDFSYVAVGSRATPGAALFAFLNRPISPNKSPALR